MTPPSKSDIHNLLKLKPYAILHNGRAGADFLQSICDGHPEILTFNGFLVFYEFWNQASTNKVAEVNVNDFLEEFIGKFIFKLKSRYDIQERKDQLGPDRNQSLNVPIDQFKAYGEMILNELGFSAKNALLAITGAYHLALGRSLSGLKVFLHHPHVEEECAPFLRDFPETTLLFMTRDPRSNFVSCINHFQKYYPQAAGNPLIYSYLHSIINDVHRYSKFSKEALVMRVETLDKQEVHNALCAHMGVQTHECMLSSTWGGLLWHGDRLSRTVQVTGLSRDILRNNWEQKLTKRDRILINHYTSAMRDRYGYQGRGNSFLEEVFVPLLAFLPMGEEMAHLSLMRVRANGLKRTVRNWLYYAMRVRLFTNFMFKKRDFSQVSFL
jgi:hypothetical protein